MAEGTSLLQRYMNTQQISDLTLAIAKVMFTEPSRKNYPADSDNPYTPVMQD
jgi:hypothetical protein